MFNDFRFILWFYVRRDDNVVVYNFIRVLISSFEYVWVGVLCNEYFVLCNDG